MSEEKSKELTPEQLAKGYRNLEALILRAKARTKLRQERLQNAKTNLEQVLEKQKARLKR